jgi:rSAM/selenodomain-associated transferase 2
MTAPDEAKAPVALAIVVPMLDEAATLPELLAHLAVWRDRGCEIVLVDGGSRDDSVAIARAAGFRVMVAERGRACQMNAGARACGGAILLFLHADTRLPAEADTKVRVALEGGVQVPAGPSAARTRSARCAHAWGRFDVRIDGRPRMLRVVAALMNLRSRSSGIATGDQAVFVRRDVFEALGGFPDQPLMEDIELSRRLLRVSRPACLRARVRTSGRRWEQRGVWRTIFLMWRLRWAYWRGVPAERLAEAYR